MSVMSEYYYVSNECQQPNGDRSNDYESYPLNDINKHDHMISRWSKT